MADARAPFPFVVGSGRCGSTLLWAMLNAHPQMAVPPESPFTVELAPEHVTDFDPGRLVDALAAALDFAFWELDIGRVREDFARQPPPDYSEAMRRVYSLYAAMQDKVRYGDKTPRNATNVARIKRLWPEARVIHMVRDGRDVALSYMATTFGPTSVRDAAIRWRNRVALAEAGGRKLGAAYMTVRYEALIDDPERELRRVSSFLELEFDDRMLRYHEHFASMQQIEHAEAHANVSLPPTKGLRDWRDDMTADDVRTFERLAGPELDLFGYERRTTNPSWRRLFGAIVPFPRVRLALRNSVVRARRDGVRTSAGHAARATFSGRGVPRR